MSCVYIKIVYPLHGLKSEDISTLVRIVHTQTHTRIWFSLEFQALSRKSCEHIAHMPIGALQTFKWRHKNAITVNFQKECTQVFVKQSSSGCHFFSLSTTTLHTIAQNTYCTKHYSFWTPQQGFVSRHLSETTKRD